MSRLTALSLRLAVCSVLLLASVLPVVTTAAQVAAVQVLQGPDGALYLAQGANAWTMVPNPISDADLAALTPSGELDGAIPAPFLTATDVLAPLQAVQDSSGTLYLVQGSNVWTLVPAPIGDADLAALTLNGEVRGQIAAPALTPPGPPVDAAPPPTDAAPPPTDAVAQPTALPVSQPSAPAPVNPNGTIKIVSSLPRTGVARSQTDSIVNAFNMALDEVQHSAGGATITYQDVDGATRAKGDWDAAQEAQNASQAINDSGVMVFIGGASGEDLNATPGQFGFSASGGPAKVSIPILCHSSAIGMISPVSTYAGLTKKVTGAEAPNEPEVYYEGCARNYTRVLPANDVQGAAAARWSKDLGATKAYVLYDLPEVGGVAAAAYAAAAPKVGLRLVGGPVPIDPTNYYNGNYVALIQQIRQSGADVVFIGGDAQGNLGRLWHDLRAALGDIKLMDDNSIYNKGFIDAAGSAAEGTYTVSSSVAYGKLSGAGAQWYASYKARFNSEPSGYAIYGYEAMRVALNAIQRAGKKDRTAIRDAILSTKNFAGPLGEWSFTETGDTTLTTVYGRQIRNGQFDEANAAVLHAP